MNKGEGIGRTNQTDTRAGRHADGLFDLSLGADAYCSEIQLGTLRFGPERSKIRFVIGVRVRIEQKANAGNAGSQLLQQAGRLSNHRIVYVAEARNVAARPCNT